MSDISEIQVKNTKYTIKDKIAREDITSIENDLNDNYYTKTESNNLLNLKADKSEIPDVSNFITKDVNDLTNYTNNTNLATALNLKADKSEIPDVSNFITKDVNDLTYYTLTSNLSNVATSGSYTDLTNKPTIPTKTSELNNDSGFITNTVNNLTNYTKSSDLSSVATSGNYNDLSNKPTIPDVSNFITKDVNDLTYYTTTTNMNTALSNKVDKTDYTDSGWVNLTVNQGTWEYAKIRKIGKIVEIRAYSTSFGAPSGTVFTLPSGYAPSDPIYLYGGNGWTTAPTISRWVITADGKITIDWALSFVDGTNLTTNTWKRFNITYMID